MSLSLDIWGCVKYATMRISENHKSGQNDETIKKITTEFHNLTLDFTGYLGTKNSSKSMSNLYFFLLEFLTKKQLLELTFQTSDEEVANMLSNKMRRHYFSEIVVGIDLDEYFDNLHMGVYKVVDIEVSFSYSE